MVEMPAINHEFRNCPDSTVSIRKTREVLEDENLAFCISISDFILLSRQKMEKPRFPNGSLVGIVRTCFFEAEESKIVNGVSVSATNQHIEVPINANNIQLDNQSRLC